MAARPAVGSKRRPADEPAKRVDTIMPQSKSAAAGSRSAGRAAKRPANEPRQAKPAERDSDSSGEEEAWPACVSLQDAVARTARDPNSLLAVEIIINRGGGGKTYSAEEYTRVARACETLVVTVPPAADRDVAMMELLNPQPPSDAAFAQVAPLLKDGINLRRVRMPIQFLLRGMEEFPLIFVQVNEVHLPGTNFNLPDITELCVCMPLRVLRFVSEGACVLPLKHDGLSVVEQYLSFCPTDTWHSQWMKVFSGFSLANATPHSQRALTLLLRRMPNLHETCIDSLDAAALWNAAEGYPPPESLRKLIVHPDSTGPVVSVALPRLATLEVDGSWADNDLVASIRSLPALTSLALTVDFGDYGEGDVSYMQPYLETCFNALASRDLDRLTHVTLSIKGASRQSWKEASAELHVLLSTAPLASVVPGLAAALPTRPQPGVSSGAAKHQARQEINQTAISEAGGFRTTVSVRLWMKVEYPNGPEPEDFAHFSCDVVRERLE